MGDERASVGYAYGHACNNWAAGQGSRREDLGEELGDRRRVELSARTGGAEQPDRGDGGQSKLPVFMASSPATLQARVDGPVRHGSEES